MRHFLNVPQHLFWLGLELGVARRFLVRPDSCLLWKSVSLGISSSTADVPSLNLSWEHHNPEHYIPTWGCHHAMKCPGNLDLLNTSGMLGTASPQAGHTEDSGHPRTFVVGL